MERIVWWCGVVVVLYVIMGRPVWWWCSGGARVDRPVINDLAVIDK